MKPLLLLLLLRIMCFNHANGQTCTATIIANGSTEFCTPQRVVLSANTNEVGWSRKADFPGAVKTRTVRFSILGKGYVGISYSSNISSKEFWEFDPVANTWTQKADFGGERRVDAVGFSINDKGYVGAGYDGTLLNDFWEYDPAANAWSRKADMPGKPRIGSSLLAMGDRGFLIGGWDGTYRKDVWEYNPQLDQWLQKKDFPGTARRDAPAFEIDGMGYLGTGISNKGQAPGNNNDFWQYNPVADHWVRKADFAGISEGPNAGFSTASKGYIGTRAPDDIYSFWEYDPLTDTWVKKQDLPGFMHGLNGFMQDIRGFSIGDKGYVAFYDNLSSLHVYEYDPTSTSTYLWSTGETTPSIVATQTGAYTVSVTDDAGCTATSAPLAVNATLLPAPTIYASDSASSCEGNYVVLSANTGTDTWTHKSNFGGINRTKAASFVIGGHAYVGLGGSSRQPDFNTFWAYDPVVDTWTQRADFPGSWRVSPVSFSVGTKGYVGTGRNINDIYLKDIWEYDPGANSWKQKADFAGSPRFQATAFSIGSKGYLGSGYNGVYPNDLWEYDPATDHWTQKASMETQGRAGGVGLSIGGKGYVGMGYWGPSESNTLHDFWQYDPTDNSWLQKANFPADYNLSFLLPTLPSFSIGDNGFVANLEFPKNELWQYDPAYNAWTLKKAFSGPDRKPNATGFAIGNRGYISMGSNSSGGLNDLWEYKPEDEFSYLWSTGEATPSIVVKKDGSFSVSIQNAQGCSGTSAPVTVRVGTLFPTPVVLADGPTTFCEGRTVTLSVNKFWENDPGGSTGADYTYLWSTGETTPDIVVSTSGTYTLRVSNKSGCTQVTAPVEAVVNVGSVPEPKITSNRIPTGVEGYWFCQGETIDFTAIPGTPDPGISYLWSTGATTQSITVGEEQTLYVTTTDQNGCSATSGYVYAYMEPTPEQPGAYTVPPDCSGKNGFIGISVQQPGNTSAYTIDGFATSSSGSDFFGLGPGTYLVGVQSFRGCLSEIFPITLEAPEYSPMQIVCQPGLEISASQGICSAAVVVNPPAASGGCGELTVTSSHPGSSFPVGTTVVTWTVTDSNGETATCEQTVTVTDNTPPTLVCQPDMLLETTSSGEVVHFSPPAGQDNCGQVTVQQTEGPASGSLFPVGKTKISFTATDEARNSTTCSFIITVAKKACITPPTFTLQVTNSKCLGTNTGSIVINASGETGSYTYSIDNGDTYSQQNSFAGLGAGNYMVRVQSDGCISPARLVSITASASGQLNIICPKDITVQPTSLNGSRVSFAQPRITNDCPGTVVTQTAGPSSGSVFPIGVTKVTFKATNAAGNSSTCSFLVRVLDPYCSGSGNNKKVYVCHKGQTICVSVNALAAHLGHGDKLGQCGNSYAKPVAEPAVPTISVFPNPTKGQFTVQLKNIPAADATLQIVDAMGSIIENRSVKKAAFSSTISVNLKNKASGVYQVRFASDTEVYTTKVIVE
ncbi:MAG: HYR domain-containing protein [Ferruginibacter sp.]|nr:HYR domain-containing protein [Ferruginibacter sp.]